MKKVLLIARAKTERTLELADIFAGNVRQLLEDDLIFHLLLEFGIILGHRVPTYLYS